MGFMSQTADYKTRGKKKGINIKNNGNYNEYLIKWDIS